MKKNAWSVAILASLSIAAPAQACTLCTCTASTSGLSFGSYDASSASPDDTSGTISLSCTGVELLTGTVTVAGSAGSSGNASARRMTLGSSTLSYNLYTDNARTSIWGDGSGSTSTINSTLNGLLSFSQSVTVYGRIPGHQWVGAGNYSDAIIVTITY